MDEVGKDMKLVFILLYGIGWMFGEKVLKNVGFKNFSVVKE